MADPPLVPWAARCRNLILRATAGACLLCVGFGAGFIFGGHDVRMHIRVAAFDTRHTYGPYYGECPMDAGIAVCAVNTRSELKGEIRE